MPSTPTKSKSVAKSGCGFGTDIPAVVRSVAKTRESATTRRKAKTVGISYQRNTGVDAYVRAVDGATPMEIIAIERQGVPGTFIEDLAKQMDLPTSRMFNILGVSKATVKKQVAAGENIDGCAGQSALRMIKLLGIAQDLVSNSTALEAKNFDSAQWLGQWIERPQPALGGAQASRSD